jgi:hypothetical protein
MFAMINLGPILITLAVVAILFALVAIGVVVAGVAVMRNVFRRRAAVGAVAGVPEAVQRPGEFHAADLPQRR